MEKAIATVMLTVAGIAAIAAVLNAFMPALYRTNGSIVASADSINGQISTQIQIVHATGIDDATTADAWIKNIGSMPVAPVDKVDVFFGPANDFVRVPFDSGSCVSPCWSFTLENDTTWAPTATLHVTLTLSQPLETGTAYYIKVVAPNGVSDARFFTV